MDDIILKVEGLTQKYDRFSLNNVSFSIPRGYIMGFVGRNGAGKSTTIKCIMNLIEYDRGKIEVFGLDNKRRSIEIKNRVGYVSEEQYFYEDMTVEWTGNFIGEFYSNWDNNVFNSLLYRFDVDRKKKIKELSRGMKMKLSLALAMAHNPELLILDEPTSGLDPVIRNELLEMFLEIIQDERRSILFSSHITSDIEKVADFVTVIDNGKVVLSKEKHLIMDEWKIVKAENTYCSEEICKKLIGVKKGDFGFSGATDKIEEFTVKFKELYPQGSFKTEKIDIDELLLRIVKEADGK